MLTLNSKRYTLNFVHRTVESEWRVRGQSSRGKEDEYQHLSPQVVECALLFIEKNNGIEWDKKSIEVQPPFDAGKSVIRPRAKPLLTSIKTQLHLDVNANTT